MVNIILNGTAFNVEDYGASIESADNSTAFNNCITAASGNGYVFLPTAGDYLVDEITPLSNVDILGANGARLVKLSGTANNYIIRTFSDVSNFKIYNVGFGTNRVSGISTQALIYFDGGDYDGIGVYNCNFTNTTAGCNHFFVKTGTGKTVNNIDFNNNVVYSCGRIAFEVINHDNTTNFNATNIRADNNTIHQSDSMGISISGAIDGLQCSGNYIKDATNIGIELVGTHNANVVFNQFEGTIGSIISSSGIGLSTGSGIRLVGNKTIGKVNGRVYLDNAGDIYTLLNEITMTDRLRFVGANTSGSSYGDRIITEDVNAVIFDNSPNNSLDNGYYDNSGTDTNFSTIRAFNSGATGNSISNSTIVKKAGGSYVDSQNGAGAVSDTNNTKTQV